MPKRSSDLFDRRVVGSEEMGGVVIPNTDGAVSVHLLDGCAHQIVYSPPLKLSAGESISVTVSQKDFSVAYTDNMLNW